MVPLPGPGWIIVIAGLAILAIEFAWAKHLLRLTRRHVHNWTQWIAARSLPVRLAFGVAGLIGLAFGVYMGVRFGFGVDLLKPFWAYVTTHRVPARPPRRDALMRRVKSRLVPGRLARAGEHSPHTRGVTGSIPVSPTRCITQESRPESFRGQAFVCFPATPPTGAPVLPSLPAPGGSGPHARVLRHLRLDAHDLPVLASLWTAVLRWDVFRAGAPGRPRPGPGRPVVSPHAGERPQAR